MATFGPLPARRGPAATARPRLPELHLIVLWCGCLVGFVSWLWREMSALDLAVVLGMHGLCFSVILRSTTPGLLASLTSPITGLIFGLQLVDLCFDFCIFRNQSLRIGGADVSAKELAYHYYHVVINAPHVNAVLLGIILISFLGSIAGLGRSSAAGRRGWCAVGAAMSVGVTAYLTCVVPRYLGIRSSTAYDPALFEGWDVVLAARFLLYASLALSLPFQFHLQGIRDDDECEGVRVKLM